MTLRAVVVAALALIVCSCEKSKALNEVVGAKQENDGGATIGKSEVAVEMDTANRYPSTVIVASDRAMTEGEGIDCSGVLIGPRAVLTAAHCVCMPQEASGNSDKGKILDATSCVRKARVTAVAYEPPTQGEDLSSGHREYAGQVRPHPEFKMMLDPQGHVLSVSSDLAVITLSKPIKDVMPSVIAGREREAGDPTVIVAFIRDEAHGGMYARRSFSKTTVLSAPKDGSKSFLVEWTALMAGRGGSGGPCLSAGGQGSVLSGVAVGGQDRQVVCVSTYAHRAWLESEIQQAAGTGAP